MLIGGQVTFAWALGQTCGQLGSAGQLIQRSSQHEDVGLVQRAEVIVEDLLWDVPAPALSLCLTFALPYQACCSLLWHNVLSSCQGMRICTASCNCHLRSACPGLQTYTWSPHPSAVRHAPSTGSAYERNKGHVLQTRDIALHLESPSCSCTCPEAPRQVAKPKSPSL